MTDMSTKPHVVALIQCRMGSTRLPEKVMMDLCGKPVIGKIFDRLKACRTVDEIVICTADTPQNQVIVDYANANHLPVHAGSENDLVDRIYQMAKRFHADVVIRVTADCPLVDPALVDRLVDASIADPTLEYITNILPPTFPDGLDLDVVSMKAIQKVWDRSRGDAFKSEWFNHDLRNNPDIYKTLKITNDVDLSQMRWTVDYPEDMELIRVIFTRLSPNGEPFGMNDILKLLEEHPVLGEINAKYVRDAAYYAAIEAAKTSTT
jgi:spore coat polysaccharide biosynthesis protein SpsF (cytidylyltransferase family)